MKKLANTIASLAKKALAVEAVRHAVFAFTATFGLALIGFLNDVQSAMATGGHLPSVAIPAKAAMSALAAAATGLVAWIAQKAAQLRDQRAG